MLKKIISEIEGFNIQLENREEQISLTPFKHLQRRLSENLEEQVTKAQVIKWLNSLHDFLSVKSIPLGKTSPNQLGEFNSVEILYKDENVPDDLKKILAILNPKLQAEGKLAETELKYQPKHSFTTFDISKQIDDIVKSEYKDRIDDSFKEAIRLLVVEWFTSAKYPLEVILNYPSKQATSETINRNYFDFAYGKKESLEINLLWTIEERKEFQALRKILPAETRKALIENPNIVEENKKLRQENEALSTQLSQAKKIFDKFPDLTPERLEQLLIIEELSKGWSTDVTYSPSEEEIRINFENGWKGEAFVYKSMQEAKFNVTWPNKSSTVTGNFIEDHWGESHYIDDKGHKFDLEVLLSDTQKAFIQVKTTTTDITRADNIALPISSREWNFVHEISQGSSYYLARVFNINTAPQLYLMRLNTMEELNDS